MTYMKESLSTYESNITYRNTTFFNKVSMIPSPSCRQLYGALMNRIKDIHRSLPCFTQDENISSRSYASLRALDKKVD